MKVLWLINYPLAMIAEKLKQKTNVNEGWLTGLANNLKRKKDISLVLCFPLLNENENGKIGNIEYIGYADKKEKTIYKSDLKNIFKEILWQVKPDVIHIMGSEFPHCLSMVEAAKECEIDSHVLISIQGLVSVYAKHYAAYMPYERFYKMKSIRDIVKRVSLRREQEQYKIRGEYETKALQNVKYVMGRTDWDYACTKQINPDVTYFYGGETLRDSFYNHQWSLDTCKKHTIFFSQATYPIKGFHIMLEALTILLRKYPDCKLYVASNVPYLEALEKPRWRNSQYVNYICDLMSKNHLTSKIIFLGSLDEEKMCEAFMSAHVFVSASSIENSPNSVGEAMKLGVPLVASNVGGTSSLLEHRKEGFLYPADEPYMLAYYVDSIFSDDALANMLSQNEKQRGIINYDREKNVMDVVGAYETIVMNQKCVDVDSLNSINRGTLS